MAVACSCKKEEKPRTTPMALVAGLRRPSYVPKRGQVLKRILQSMLSFKVAWRLTKGKGEGDGTT